MVIKKKIRVNKCFPGSNCASAPIITPQPQPPVKPKPGKPGAPNPNPIFPTGAGHFHVNEHGNTVRISASGQAPRAEWPTPFQGVRTPSGNPVVNYRPRVGVNQDTPVNKVAGSPILTMKSLPGNPVRRAAQPVSTVLPYSRKMQNGGQAFLPSYKRRKMGRQG